MKSKFSSSLEMIPRQKSFACLSLKFGSILSGLIIILYSVFALAQCFVAFGMLPTELDPNDWNIIFAYSVVFVLTFTHAFTLFLTALMLAGVIRDKLKLIRPWIVWTSIQVSVSVIMFIFWSTMSVINHTNDSSLMLFIIEFLSLMVRFYMLMIVASFYKQLEEGFEETERLRGAKDFDQWYSA
ncbi:unnamed protein product [Leptidea sinapis]|uniref:MARVEL domain-containing protein n=1 Tax=Leptidea sinapis TaxID=189913 RepID=A0A5E4QVJ0_9NEOP|nr:unnamed protein product [Leptidea sinapis]